MKTLKFCFRCQVHHEPIPGYEGRSYNESTRGLALISKMNRNQKQRSDWLILNHAFQDSFLNSDIFTFIPGEAQSGTLLPAWTIVSPESMCSIETALWSHWQINGFYNYISFSVFGSYSSLFSRSNEESNGVEAALTSRPPPQLPEKEVKCFAVKQPMFSCES